jgi:hypothetical protein
LICVDFDGTLISNNRPWDDIEVPLELLPGALAGLKALKAAGHTLLLYSARANRALMYMPEFDPLVRSGDVSGSRFDRTKQIAADRFRQMQEFVELELPGIFDGIDDGRQGKPDADLFIDDKAVTFGPRGMNWRQIANIYGD